jgi:PEGA domain
MQLIAQTVKNIKTKTNEKSIIITYDLIADNPQSRIDITVFFGDSKSQLNYLTNASGDIGTEVEAGTNKEILITDLEAFGSDLVDLTFRIVASYTHNLKVGTLSVTTDPAEAKLYIEKVLVGKTDIVLDSQRVGTYHLKLVHQGYLTVEKEVNINEGETTHLNEILTPGYLSTINSNPSESELIINGAIVGSTPLEVILKPGENEIKLKKKYYHEYVTSTIPTRQNKNYRLNLTKKDYSVNISTYPEATNFSLDGEFYDDEDILSLSGGNNAIVIAKKNYVTYKGVFAVADKKDVQQFNFFLEPEQYRNKGMALVYSLLLPGYGQRYLKRGGYEPIMGIAGYGLLIGSLDTYNKAVKSYDLYLAETDADMRDSLNKQWQDQKKQSGIMLYSAGAIWLGNIIWTLLIDDEAARYQKIKTEIKFDNVTNNKELSFLFPLNKKPKK